MKIKKACFFWLVAMTLPVATVMAQDVPVITVNAGDTGRPVQGRALSQNSELLWTVQQLQDEVRQLRGQVEAQQYRLDQMTAKQKARYRDLDRRISVLLQAQDTASQPMTDPAEKTKAPATPPPDVEQKATATTVKPPVKTAAIDADLPSDKAAYQAAFELVRERQFNEAAQQFEQFLTAYQNSPRLANAHYWLGEIYLAQAKYKPSEAAFKRVVEQFANSRKAPDAMYKLGVLYKQQGNLEKYAAYMANVVKLYPDTSAARLAESALSQ